MTHEARPEIVKVSWYAISHVGVAVVFVVAPELIIRGPYFIELMVAC